MTVYTYKLQAYSCTGNILHEKCYAIEIRGDAHAVNMITWTHSLQLNYVFSNQSNTVKTLWPHPDHTLKTQVYTHILGISYLPLPPTFCHTNMRMHVFLTVGPAERDKDETQRAQQEQQSYSGIIRGHFLITIVTWQYFEARGNILKHMRAGLAKPCLFFSCLLNLAKATVVTDFCLKGVCLSSILFHLLL